jgi:hypothetical protein
VLQAGDGPVHDPELGRVVQHWSGMEAATLARAWLRFGPDRLDKLTEVSSMLAGSSSSMVWQQQRQDSVCLWVHHQHIETNKAGCKRVLLAC